MDYLKSVARGLCLWKDPGLVDLNNAVIFCGLTGLVAVGVTLVLAFIPLVLHIVLLF